MAYYTYQPTVCIMLKVKRRVHSSAEIMLLSVFLCVTENPDIHDLDGPLY